MGVAGLSVVLALLNLALAGCCLIMRKQIRELQQWRQDVTAICMQQIRSDDHA